jgi:hypothetical protein
MAGSGGARVELEANALAGVDRECGNGLLKICD